MVRVGYFMFCKNGTRLHLNLTEAGEQGSAGQWSEWHCFGRWGRSWEVQGTSDGKGREDAERRKDCCPGRNLGEKKTNLGMSVTSLDWRRDKPGNRYAEHLPDKALGSCDQILEKNVEYLMVAMVSFVQSEVGGGKKEGKKGTG